MPSLAVAEEPPAFPGTDPATPLVARFAAHVLSLEDAERVSLWTDASGNGADAVAAGDRRPTYHTGVQAGRAGVYWDWTNQNRMVTPPVALSTFTMFFVHRLDAGAEGLFLEQGPGYPDPGCYLFTDIGDTAHVTRPGPLTSDHNSVSFWGLDLFPDTADLVTWEFDGTHAGHTVRKNRAAIAPWSGATGGPAFEVDPGGAVVTDVLYLGGRSDNSLSVSGYFFEIDVFSPQLSVSDRDLLESYLRDFWATR
jgi:hypothetical protein